jgi:hypothetical protein
MQESKQRRCGSTTTKIPVLRLAAASSVKVWGVEVQVAVVTPCCRAPPQQPRLSTSAGSDARKYLRRGRDFAG